MTPKNRPDILAQELTSEKGISDTGIQIRRSDKRNPGVMSHGYGRVMSPEAHSAQAKVQLHHIIKTLKNQPKPNLPKSDLEKTRPLMNPNSVSSEKGIHTPRGETPKKRGTSKMHIMDDPQAKLEIKRVLAEARSMPKPNLPKSESQSSDLQKDDMAAKIKAKSLGSPFGPKAIERINQNVGAKHYSEQAKQQGKVNAVQPRPVAPAPARQSPPVAPGPKKIFDPSKSGKVDYFKKDAKEKPKIVPAIVSEPIVIGRGTETTPKIIDQPNQVTVYKDIIKALHKSSMQKSEPKYINVHQDWVTKKMNNKTGKMEHPLFDKGQKKLEHVNDVKHMEHFLNRKLSSEHTEPHKQSGMETYKVHPGGKLEFIQAHHDTKGT